MIVTIDFDERIFVIQTLQREWQLGDFIPGSDGWIFNLIYGRFGSSEFAKGCNGGHDEAKYVYCISLMYSKDEGDSK